MLARPRVLSLITTRRCTAECDHCCMGSSPRATQAIPIARMHSLIDEAKRIPSIECIGFSGGECFLLGHDLDALIAHAHELEFTTRVITNGYWAVNEKAARTRVASLRMAGLDEMMLSTGTFHQEFVPVERIVHAARAAAATDITVRITIEACDQQTFDETWLLAELAAEITARQIYLGRDPWTTDAGGRGVVPVTHEALLAADGANRALGPCSQILDIITVSPDQQLLACCGFPMEQLPALRIGSVREESLADVLADSPNELLKMWLHVAGPSGIADFVARYVPGYRLAPSVSICQSCVALQRDTTAMAILAEHCGEIIESVVADFAVLTNRRVSGGQLTRTRSEVLL